MVAVRGNHEVYFLLADVFADFVTNGVYLFAMNKPREHCEINIAAATPVIHPRAEKPDVSVGVEAVDCGRDHPLLVLGQSHVQDYTIRGREVPCWAGV